MKKAILIAISIIGVIAIAYGSFVGYIYYKDYKRVSDIKESVLDFHKKYKNSQKLDNLHIAVIKKSEKLSSKKGNKLVLVDVELISSVEENENFIEYNPNQFILKYDGQFKIAECKQKFKEKLLKHDKLYGGQTAKGSLCFEIPKDSTHFSLEVFDDFIGDNEKVNFQFY